MPTTLSLKRVANGVSRHAPDPATVLAAAERRLAGLIDDRLVASWRLHEVSRNGTNGSATASAKRVVEELTTEVEAQQILVSDLRLRLERDQLDHLEAEVAALRQATDDAYADLRAARDALDRFPAEANRRWRTLRDAQDSVLAIWRNLGPQIAQAKARGESTTELERALARAPEEARAAIEALSEHERQTYLRPAELEAEYRAADQRWNALLAQSRQAGQRFAQVRRPHSSV